MYYPCSITILSDGKMVTAIDNKTGRQAISRSLPPYNDLNAFEFVYKATSAIESLVEAQVDKDEIKVELKVGDRVYLNDNFDKHYVYAYEDYFVSNLPITNLSKARYCYSISNPPIHVIYYVLAIKDDKAYIQTARGQNRCYLVDTKILKKVTE